MVTEIISYVLAAGSIPLLYTAIKSKAKITKVRHTMAAGFLALMPFLGSMASDRMEGINKCKDLLNNSNAIAYTQNNYERHRSIEQFCYDDPIREKFLGLVDTGLDAKLAYNKVGEEYRPE